MENSQCLLLNPLYLFASELKDKNLKKSAILGMSLIILVMGPIKTHEQFMPFLRKLFIQETNQYRLLILKAFPTTFQYLTAHPSHSFIPLEFILDILCVFSQFQIRNQAYICLQKAIALADLRGHGFQLIQMLKNLKKQPQKHIKQLILKLIPYIFIGVDSEHYSALLDITHSFEQTAQNRLLLSIQLTEFIKVMPPVPEVHIQQIFSKLMQDQNSKVRANLIGVLILLSKILGSKATLHYLTRLSSDQHSDVICACIQRISQLKQVYEKEHLQSITKRIYNFNEQPQVIKNCLLQVLDQMPQDPFQMEQFNSVLNSLQLKNTFANYLCRIKDTKRLSRLFQENDNQFRIKLFPKLPTIDDNFNLMLKIILKQKNWRGKLTVLQNIDDRINSVQCCQLIIPTLFIALFQSKTAIVRSSIINSLLKIIKHHKIELFKLQEHLQLASKSRNWFNRQSLFIILNNLQKFTIQDRKLIECYLEQHKNQKVINIKSIMQEIIKKISSVKEQLNQQ